MEIYLHQLSLILEANTTIGKESDAISNLETLQKSLKTEIVIPFSSKFSPKTIEKIFSTILSLSFKESSTNVYSNSESFFDLNPHYKMLLNEYIPKNFQQSLHHFLNHIVSLMKSFCPSTLLMILTNLCQTEEQKQQNSVIVVWIAQLIPILQLKDLMTLQLCTQLIQSCPSIYLRDIPDGFWILLREKLDKEDHLNILQNGIDLTDSHFAKQAAILCQKYPDELISIVIQKATMKFISKFLPFLPENLIFDTIPLSARIGDAINLDTDFKEMIYSFQALPYLIEKISYIQQNHGDVHETLPQQITSMSPIWKGILRQLKSLASSNMLQNFSGSRTFFIDTLLYGETHGFVDFNEILPFIDLDSIEPDQLLLSAYLRVIFNNHLNHEYIKKKVMTFLKKIISITAENRIDSEANCQAVNCFLSLITKKENFDSLLELNQEEFMEILQMLFNMNSISFHKKSILFSQLKFILAHFDLIETQLKFINLHLFVSTCMQLSTSYEIFSDDSFELLLKLIHKIDYHVAFHELDWFSKPVLVHRNFKLIDSIDSGFVFDLLSYHLIEIDHISDALSIIFSNYTNQPESASNLMYLSSAVRIAMNYFSKCIEIIGFNVNEELKKYNVNIKNVNSENNDVTWFDLSLLENLFDEIECQFEDSRFGRFLSVITEFISNGRKVAAISQNTKVVYIIYCRLLGSLIPVSASKLLSALISDFNEENDDAQPNANSTIKSIEKQFFELYLPQNHFDSVIEAAVSLYGTQKTLEQYPELVKHAITYSYNVSKLFSKQLEQPLPKLKTFLAFCQEDKHYEWVKECIKVIPFKDWIINNNNVVNDDYYSYYHNPQYQQNHIALNKEYHSFIDEIIQNLAQINNVINIKHCLKENQHINFDVIESYQTSEELLTSNDFFESLDKDHKLLLIAINSNFENRQDSQAIGGAVDLEKEKTFELKSIEIVSNEVPFKFNPSEPSTIANLISFLWHGYPNQIEKNFGFSNDVKIETVEQFVLDNFENIKLVLGFLLYVTRYHDYVIDIDKWISLFKFKNSITSTENDFYTYSVALIIESMVKKQIEIIKSQMRNSTQPTPVNSNKSQRVESSTNEAEILPSDDQNEPKLSDNFVFPVSWLKFINDSLQFIGCYSIKSLITVFFRKRIGFASLVIRSIFRICSLIYLSNETIKSESDGIFSIISSETITQLVNNELCQLQYSQSLFTMPSSVVELFNRQDNELTQIESQTKEIDLENLKNLATHDSQNTLFNKLLISCIESINGRTTVDIYSKIVSTLSSTIFSKCNEGPKYLTNEPTINELKCFDLLPSNYHHPESLLSYGQKLQDVHSVLVPSSFIQNILTRIDEETVVYRDFFTLLFSLALNTDQYLRVCKILEDKCPCTQDHLRLYFSKEEVYDEFFYCKPPSYLRGIIRTSLSKFTLASSKPVLEKFKSVTGFHRVHPCLCYIQSKKNGMKPWKLDHSPELTTLLEIGYVDLRNLMRSFTEIATEPLSIFTSISSIKDNEIDKLCAWPSATEAREDFAKAILQITVKNDKINEKDDKNGCFGNLSHYYDDFGHPQSFYFYRDIIFSKMTSDLLLEKISLDTIAKIVFDTDFICNVNECNSPINTAIIINSIVRFARKMKKENVINQFEEMMLQFNQDNFQQNNPEIIEFLKNMNKIGMISKELHPE